MTGLAYAGIEKATEHPWLHRFVFGLDGWLQKRACVMEFSAHPDCIFRVQITHAASAFSACGGYRVAAGDRLLNLHLWNEHIPPVPGRGATLAWARKLGHCLEISLNELAGWLSAQPELADIALIYANAALGTAMQTEQIVRISQRYGFEPAPEDTLPKRGRLHRLGENVLISLMILAHNPLTLRSDSLRRGRVPLVLTRERLLARYARAGLRRPS